MVRVRVRAIINLITLTLAPFSPQTTSTAAAARPSYEDLEVPPSEFEEGVRVVDYHAVVVLDDKNHEGRQTWSAWF
jgi:hypothetical protein